MSEMSEYDMDAIYHEVNPSTNLKKAMFWPDIISSSSESIVLAISVLMSF